MASRSASEGNFVTPDCIGLAYRRLFCLMAAVFIAHLDANLSGPAIYLLEIKTGSPASEVSSLTSLYFGAEVCGFLAGGAWYLNRDTAKIVRLSMWITALSLLSASLIDDMLILNVVRIAQGFSAGLLVVAFLVDVKRYAKPNYIVHFVAGNSAATLVAAIAAPVIAATLPLEKGGDWLFAIPLPLILVSIAAFPSPKKSTFDSELSHSPLSFFNLAWLFPVLVIAVWALEKERGVESDTEVSWWLMGMVVTFCLLFFVFSRALLKKEDRLFSLPPLRKSGYLYFALPTALISGATIFGGNYLLSFQLIEVHKAGPDILLKLTLLMAVPQLLLLPFFIWLNKTVSPFLSISLGAALCGISFLIMINMTPGTNVPDMYLTQFLRVVGIPLVAMPLTLMVVNHTPDAYLPTATSLLSISRILGGSLGIAVPLWYIRERQDVWLGEVSMMMPAWGSVEINKDELFVWALMECNFLWGMASLLISLASFLLFINNQNNKEVL